MEQLIDLWVKSNSPAITLVREKSGTHLTQYLVVLLFPNQSVKELYFISDGFNFSSTHKANETLLDSFSPRRDMGLLDRLETYAKVYPSRAEWLKNKIQLKNSGLVDAYYKKEIVDLHSKLMNLEFYGFRFSHIEYIDSKTMALYPMYDGQLLDSIFEFRIGVDMTLTYKKYPEVDKDFLKYLKNALNPITLVEVHP